MVNLYLIYKHNYTANWVLSKKPSTICFKKEPKILPKVPVVVVAEFGPLKK